MSEIAVIKGNDIRDKKLADSTAQTEVASTDGIRMVTTTGQEVYIARDSFANEVMKVINENVKTTVDGVFGVSGNEFGKITPANLATLVGGCKSIDYYYDITVSALAANKVPVVGMTMSGVQGGPVSSANTYGVFAFFPARYVDGNYQYSITLYAFFNEVLDFTRFFVRGAWSSDSEATWKEVSLT